VASRELTPAMRTARSAALALVLAICGGCASGPAPHYAWGSYEDLIYTTHAKPGAVTADAQIEQLEADRQAALAAQGRLPPGWRMHLATLYQEAGRPDNARQELLAEKAAFPESATLVDRLIANLDAGSRDTAAAAP
jgi:hypothetical protein